MITPFEQNEIEQQYYYLLEQQKVRTLQDYELDEMEILQTKLNNNEDEV